MMAISRRGFLALAGAGVVAAALDVGGLVSPGLATPVFADTVPPTPARGLFGGLTTLDQTVKQPVRQDTRLWTDYVKLTPGPGEAHMVRTELSGGVYRDPTLALAAFVQITDLQIVDDKSPGRVEFADRWADLFFFENESTGSAYRPHEMLSTHIAESMAQAIRGVGHGPMTGLPLAFTIATGDMVDNVQYNETRWYIDLLDGGHTIRPESGVVGDQHSVSEFFSDVFAHDRHYWSPEGVPPGDDRYRGVYGFPRVSGLMSAARRPYMSTGLGMPWYAAMGNHDGEIQGNYPIHPTFVESTGLYFYDGLPDISGQAISNQKAYDTLAPFPDPPSVHDLDIFLANLEYSEVPADQNRHFLRKQPFVDEHFNTNTSPGPVGHGFERKTVPFVDPVTDELTTILEYKTYYKFDEVTDLIQWITLDTVCYDGGANGRIPADQFSWLESQLMAHSSFYYDDALNPIHQSGVPDKLIVLFGHHTIESISNGTTDKVHIGDDDFYYGKAVERLLLRYPNVILYVCGHTHRNIITAHPRGTTTGLGNSIPGRGGFWQISTASHIDWPVQSRVLELAADANTISIFTTMVDIAAPVDYHGDLSSPTSLASLARELAANDPTERPAGSNDPTHGNLDGENGRRGHGYDRNTQLMVAAPFSLPAVQEFGPSVAVARNDNGRLEVFGTNVSDQIFHAPQTTTGSNTLSGWSQYDGLLHTVAAATNGNGLIELFGINGAGGIYHRAQTAKNAGTWTAWANIPGGLVCLDVALNSDGRLEIFGVNAGGVLYHSLQTAVGSSSWGSWEIRGDSMLKVAVATNTNGRVEIFGLLRDSGALMRLVKDPNGTFGDWSMFEANMHFTSIAAVRNDDGRLEVIATDNDRLVLHRTQQTAGSSSWTGWVSRDTGPVSRMTQLAAETNLDGTIELFGIDHAGGIWHRRQTAKNSPTWSSWTVILGRLRPDVPGAPASLPPPPPPVAVPDVTGRSEATAKSTLQGKGFAVSVTPIYDCVDPGLVAEQSPAFGDTAPAGSTVTIFVHQKTQKDGTACPAS